MKMVCVLPKQIRRNELVAKAYTDLLVTLQGEGLVRSNLCALSARNLLCFVYRLCRETLGTMAPWTLERLLERYRLLHIRCNTPVALRTHAHWIIVLLQCPGYGTKPEGELLAAKVAHQLRLGPSTTTIIRSAKTLRRHTFTPEEVRRLYKVAVDDPFDHLMLLLLFTTALRVGGLSRLPHVTAVDSWCITTEKAGVRFPVALAPCVRDAIAVYGRSSKGDDSVYLFPSRYDPSKPISTSYLQRRFQRICTRAGVTGSHAHIHTTRHTVATALRLSGARIIDVAAFLGHANPVTTLSVYCTPDFNQLINCLKLPWYERGGDEAGTYDNTLLHSLTGTCPLPPPPPPLGGCDHVGIATGVSSTHTE